MWKIGIISWVQWVLFTWKRNTGQTSVLKKISLIQLFHSIIIYWEPLWQIYCWEQEKQRWINSVFFSPLGILKIYRKGKQGIYTTTLKKKVVFNYIWRAMGIQRGTLSPVAREDLQKKIKSKLSNNEQD